MFSLFDSENMQPGCGEAGPQGGGNDMTGKQVAHKIWRCHVYVLHLDNTIRVGEVWEINGTVFRGRRGKRYMTNCKRPELPCLLEDQIQYSERFEQEDQEQHGRDESDHDRVELSASESLAVLGRFRDDHFGLGNPTDQDAGSDRKERHEDVVAQVIHDVQYLGLRSVRERCLKVQDVISETHDYAKDQG